MASDEHDVRKGTKMRRGRQLAASFRGVVRRVAALGWGRGSDVPTDHLLNRIRNAVYFGIRYPWVDRGTDIHVQWSTRIWSPHRHVVLGNHVGIGYNCLIQCDTEIGNNVLIASNVAILGADDHRFDVIGKPIWESGRGDQKSVIIEDDVWIGYGVIILSGSRIGRGAVIGAGAIIAGNIEPYNVVVPSRSRSHGMRFGDEELKSHERLMAERRDIRRPTNHGIASG